MPHNRYFIDETIEIDKTYPLLENELHHLNVMRSSSGDKIEVINGKGFLYEGIVTNIEKRSAEITIIKLLEKADSEPDLFLAQCFPKLSSLELILEKGIELGCTRFFFFPSKLSEKVVLTENKKQRLEHIKISSMKQCGRLFIPQITFLDEMVELQEISVCMLYGDISKNSPDMLHHVCSDKPYLFINGPEKGFTENEIAVMEETLFAKGVSLSPNILRCETAAIAAMAVLAQKL